MPRGVNIAILLIVALGGILFVVFAPQLELVACPFKFLTGWPCPGCGGTRAASELLHGHVCRALLINPLSVLLCLWLAASFVWILSDVVRGRNTCWKIYQVRWSRRAVAAAVAVLLANWVWNICKGL